MNFPRLLLLLLLLAAATPAGAADVVTYRAVLSGNDGGRQNTTVRFDHASHAGRYLAARGCAACHAGTPQKIAISRASAHGAACLDCHKGTGGKAPTLCADCHK